MALSTNALLRDIIKFYRKRNGNYVNNLNYNKCCVCRARLAKKHIAGHYSNVHKIPKKFYMAFLAGAIETNEFIRIYKYMNTSNKDNNDDKSTPKSAEIDIIKKELAAQIAKNPDFISSITDDVSRLLLTGPNRRDIVNSLMSAVVSRQEDYVKSKRKFKNIKNKLEQRIDENPDGTPTDTEVLIKMGNLFNSEIKAAEDLFSRAAKLAIDESKSKAMINAVPASALAFTGKDERVPSLPVDLTPQDRENMRNLVELIKKGFDAVKEARKLIDSKSTEYTVKPDDKKTNEVH